VEARTQRPLLEADSNGTGSDVLWVSYLLFSPDSRWDSFPTNLTHWGRTIVAARESLRQQFDRLFAAPAPH
jgi:hypothetical protein